MNNSLPASHVLSRRLTLSLVGILIIVAGLSARKYGSMLPEVVRAYAPDSLWAAMVYCVVAIIRPRIPPVRVWAIAILISYGVEISQLYHAPWIDTIRHTRLGGLLLGFGFLWTDIGCYTVGCSLALLADVLSNRKQKPDHTAITHPKNQE